MSTVSSAPPGAVVDLLEAPRPWAAVDEALVAPVGALVPALPSTRGLHRGLAALDGVVGRRRRPRTVLLCPGPVLLSRHVQRAVRETVMGHREPEFSRLLGATAEMLGSAIGIEDVADDYRVALITGSGTAANEAVMASVGTIGPTLVLANGEFGERLIAMARRHNPEAEGLRFPWLEAIDLVRLERELVRRPVALVVVAHHETSTGMLNPIAEIARIAHRHGALVAVDAVSSIGAEPIEAGAWGIDVLTGSSGKALSAMPGVGIVAITRDALARSASASRAAGYLDLHAHCSSLSDLAQTPNTPAVHVFVSLHAALEERARLGDRAAREAIRSRATGARRRLGEMGLGLVDHGAATASALTCVWQPEAIPFAALAGRLKERGIVVYNGKGALTDRMFQIGHIGALRRNDTRDALRAVETILRDGARPPGRAAWRQARVGS